MREFAPAASEIYSKILLDVENAQKITKNLNKALGSLQAF